MIFSMTNEAGAVQEECPPNDGNGTWISSGWLYPAESPASGYCMPWFKACCRITPSGEIQVKLVALCFDWNCPLRPYDPDVMDASSLEAWYWQRILDYITWNLQSVCNCTIPNCDDGGIVSVVLASPACITPMYRTWDATQNKYVKMITSCQSSSTESCERRCTYCWDENHRVYDPTQGIYVNKADWRIDCSYTYPSGGCSQCEVFSYDENGKRVAPFFLDTYPVCE